MACLYGKLASVTLGCWPCPPSLPVWQGTSILDVLLMGAGFCMAFDRCSPSIEKGLAKLAEALILLIYVVEALVYQPNVRVFEKIVVIGLEFVRFSPGFNSPGPIATSLLCPFGHMPKSRVGGGRTAMCGILRPRYVSPKPPVSLRDVVLRTKKNTGLKPSSWLFLVLSPLVL
jgi:hypothetical protein